MSRPFLAHTRLGYRRASNAPGCFLFFLAVCTFWLIVGLVAFGGCGGR